MEKKLKRRVNNLDLKKAAVTFGKQLGVSFATEIVRGYLTAQLKDVSPNDLYLSIMEDRDLWSVTPDKLRATGRKFKGSYGSIFNKYQENINTELILKWLNDDRLDLYSTIINIPDNKGIIWIDKQVKRIKQQIVEM